MSDSDEQAEYYLAYDVSNNGKYNTRKMQPVQPPTDDLKALLTPREYELAQQRLKRVTYRI